MRILIFLFAFSFHTFASFEKPVLNSTCEETDTDTLTWNTCVIKTQGSRSKDVIFYFHGKEGDEINGKLKAVEESQKIIISRLDEMVEMKLQINRLEKQQNDLQSALANLEKSIVNASKDNQKPTTQDRNKTTQNKAGTKWKSNIVYTAQVGDSYYMGPADAKVTITEWGDYF